MREGVTDTMQKLSIGRQHQSFGTGGGRNGSIPFGPSKATYRYPTNVLAKIYRQLLYTGRLNLPESISRDDPMLFTMAGEFVDVVEQLQGIVRRPANAYISTSFSVEPPNSTITPMNSLQDILTDSVIPVSLPNEPVHEVPVPVQQETQVLEDTYMYVDPQGIWQGPFKRSEILEWHAAGFFPLDLIMKSSLDTTGRLSTLQELLALWTGYAPSSAIPKAQTGDSIRQQDTPSKQADLNHLYAPSLQVQDAHVAPTDATLATHSIENESTEPLHTLKMPLEESHERPETKPAPWIASNSIDSAVSLRDIQQEEDARRTKLENEAKIEAQMNHHKSGWASVARSSDSLSLTDIQKEEIQSKQDLQDAFWDYGAKSNSHVLSPTSAGSGPRGWAAAAASGSRQINLNTVSLKSQPAVTERRAPPPPPPPTKRTNVSLSLHEQQNALDSPNLNTPDSMPSDDSHCLAGEFRTWCTEQMKALTGSADVTLCEFLMTVESNSEIADYIAAYLGSAPAVATFSSEFIKRKLVELANGKKSRKARAKARAKAAAAAATGTHAQETDVRQEHVDDSSWETVETSKRKSKAGTNSGQGPMRSYSSGFAVLGGQ